MTHNGAFRHGRLAFGGAALVALLLGACGGQVSQPSGPSVTAAASSVFTRALLWPQVAVLASGVYVGWQVSPPGRSGPVRSELARVDPVTGAIKAQRRLDGSFGQVIDAGGALWVATTSPDLLRLRPDTLAITGRRRVGQSGASSERLAVAGGWLWAVAGNRLLRFSMPAGQLTRSITMTGAASSSLSASTGGTALVVSKADTSGRGQVQRRDPVTGAILARFRVTGVSAPAVAGPAGSSIWITEPTGMMGYVQRLDASTLRPAANCPEGRSSNGCVDGTNAIFARLANGLLWVTQLDGGPTRNYCADPGDGRILAHIQPAVADSILAIGADRIFYGVPGPKARSYVRTRPIPAACHA